MKIDKSLLRNKAREKFANEAFDLVTGNIFVNALPMDEEVTNAYLKPLYESFTRFTSGCGGYKMIDTALENTKGKPIPHTLSSVIGDIVNATATEAADRVGDSELIEEDTLQSAVDKSSLSEAEMNRLSSRADTISPDELASHIKKKTIAVIKDERETYEKEEELKNELQEALDASEAFKGMDVETYGRTTDKFSLGHTTLFGKIQEMAYENLIYKYPYTDKDIFNTVDTVANECGKAFIKGFDGDPREFNAALEEIRSYKTKGNEEVAIDEKDTIQCMDDALLAAMVVYGMMETLNKLNFIKIDKGGLEGFIKSKLSMNPDKCNKNDIQTVKNAVNTVTGDYTRDLRKSVNRSVALERIDKLNSAKEALSIVDEFGIPSTPDPNFLEEHKKLDEVLAAYEAVVAKDRLMSDLGTTNADVLGKLADQTEKTKSANVLRCNRIDNMFASLPEITDVLFRIDPNQNFKDSIVVEAVGRGIDNTYMGSSFRNMKERSKHTLVLNSVNGVDPVEVVRTAVESSTFNGGKYSLGIQVKDGYGKILPIN